MALGENLAGLFSNNPVNRVGPTGQPLIGGSNTMDLLTRSAGGLLGREVRGRPEQLTAALSQIDPNDPQKMIKMYGLITELGEPPQQMAAMEKMKGMALEQTALRQKEQTLQGSRSITNYINQLTTEELLSKGSRSAISELERTFNLPAGQGASLIKNELEIREKAEKSKASGSGKVDTFTDKEGFRIYASGPNKGEYVRQEARDAFDAKEATERAGIQSFKDAAITALKNSTVANASALIPGVESGAMKPEEALKRLSVPTELIKEVNILSMEGAQGRSSIRQDVNLLADYNTNVPPVGTPASQLKVAEEYFTGGDKATLVKYDLQAKRVDTTNFRLPPGTASDVDVQRAESTVPPINSNPAIIRSWLLGQMKIRALMAAEAEAKATYMSGNAGSLAGFNEGWAVKTETPSQINAIYKQFGVPATTDFVRKEINAPEGLD